MIDNYDIFSPPMNIYDMLNPAEGLATNDDYVTSARYARDVIVTKLQFQLNNGRYHIYSPRYGNNAINSE